MAAEVVMPRLGWTMEEGSVVEWLKHDGEAVRAGEILFTIESDKAVNEVEAMDSGILRIPPDAPPPGTAVPIGTVLAYLVRPGEAAPFEGTVAVHAASGPATTEAVPPAPTAGGSGSGQGGASSHTPLPGDASTPGEPPSSGESGGPTGTNREAAHEWRRGPSRDDLPAISPRARRVAAELGVDWTTLPGSGRTGRIVERDVRQAAPSPEPVAAGQGVPMSGPRRLIAARLADSVRTTAPVTLTTEADATELVRLREQIKADLVGTNSVLPSYTDLLVRLAALALTEHPALNASLSGAMIVQHATVNIGIAVDTDAGLVVPVVRAAQRLSVRQIAVETARLIEQVRTRQAAPDDLRGGTFTITNLGMYEIDAFTPIINPPECAILGVGRIVARPVVVDEAGEAVAVRKMMALSLTFDHRLVDGGPAARFLQRVKQFVERPMLWLIQS